MRNEVVRFTKGEPIICTLESEGRQCASKFAPEGYQYVYDVIEKGQAKALFLPARANDTLRRLGIQRGEEIRILRVGQNGTAAYQIDRVSDAQLAVPKPAAAETHSIRMLTPRTAGTTALSPQAAPKQNYPQLETGKEYIDLAAEIIAHGIQTCERLNIPLECFEDVRALAISFLISRDRRGA